MKMYKLFVRRIMKRTSAHGVFLITKRVTVHRSLHLCSFCNFYHEKMSKFGKYFQVRTNITTANILNDSSIKTKVKKKTKKYAELLAVTNEKTCNKKTEVQKLTACNLSKFVDHFDIATYDSNTSESSNLGFPNEENEDSYNNGIHLNVENQIKYDETENDDVEEIAALCSTINKSGKKLKLNQANINNNIYYQRKTELLKNKENIDQQLSLNNLLVHIHVYLNCGLLNEASDILMKYRKHNKTKLENNTTCDASIEPYNVMLQAYLSRGNTAKVLEIYDMIKKDSLIPTPQIYVNVFDALGRETENSEQIELLNKLKAEMISYNISFNDIFTNSYISNNQYQNVLKIVKILRPNFEPSYPKLNLQYTSKLLKPISTKNKYESPVKGVLTMSELKNLSKKQIHNELANDIQIQSIEKHSEDIKMNSKKKIMELESYWKKVATAAFDKNLKCLKQKENHSHKLLIFYPFLEVLDKEFYINAILREIKELSSMSETYSQPLKTLYNSLGKFIHNKYEIEIKKRNGLLDQKFNIYFKYLEWYFCPENMKNVNNINNRTVWEYLKHQETKSGLTSSVKYVNWPANITISIGHFLYNIILNDIILPPEILKGQDLKHSIPAFYTLFRNTGHFVVEQIKPHPFLSKLYKNSGCRTLLFNSYLLPSYAPPCPWISMDSGGYLITKTNFIRISETNYLWNKYNNIKSKQLFPVFDSVNQLSSIPWKINTVILDIIIQIFRNGGSKELNVPQAISSLSRPPKVSKDATIEEKQQAAMATIRYKQTKRDMFSLWCDVLYKLSIANHFRDEIFWLPHNLDFRGRTYPIPPHLNHLSSDLSRSLLLFAKKKPLGPNGLNWLKIHVINLTGFMKGTPTKERLQYANENIDNIIDSATKPLTGKMWWAKSDEPWQTLAACIEIENALKAPNIEKYQSSFPIHQDGSCNGLQHYAALGKDQIGAESVNLCPLETPQDVYTTVASIVEARRETDAKNNHQIAEILEGFIQRKIIKQTVMTTVYGVTKYGARQQIAKQLRELQNFPEEHIWSASIYLTENTFQSLRTMFKSAREIQDWFTTCARIISSDCCECVEWITPLGFPVIQPYFKQKSQKNHGQLRLPNSVKQRNAFAPNFVHSLDSTHMMLTSLHCNKKNITFVSVHDCFWTHACTVESMNKICREQFVALHSEPILENLSKFFIRRYMSMLNNKSHLQYEITKMQQCMTSVPPKGTFNIKNVLSSEYFFS